MYRLYGNNNKKKKRLEKINNSGSWEWSRRIGGVGFKATLVHPCCMTHWLISHNNAEGVSSLRRLFIRNQKSDTLEVKRRVKSAMWKEVHPWVALWHVLLWCEQSTGISDHTLHIYSRHLHHQHPDGASPRRLFVKFPNNSFNTKKLNNTWNPGCFFFTFKRVGQNYSLKDSNIEHW